MESTRQRVTGTEPLQHARLPLTGKRAAVLCWAQVVGQPGRPAELRLPPARHGLKIIKIKNPSHNDDAAAGGAHPRQLPHKLTLVCTPGAAGAAGAYRLWLQSRKKLASKRSRGAPLPESRQGGLQASVLRAAQHSTAQRVKAEQGTAPQVLDQGSKRCCIKAQSGAGSGPQARLTRHVLPALHAPDQVKLSISKGLVQRICGRARAGRFLARAATSCQLAPAAAGGHASSSSQQRQPAAAASSAHASSGSQQQEDLTSSSKQQVDLSGFAKPQADLRGPSSPHAPPTWNDTRSPMPAACVMALARAACAAAVAAGHAAMDIASRDSKQTRVQACTEEQRYSLSTCTRTPAPAHLHWAQRNAAGLAAVLARNVPAAAANAAPNIHHLRGRQFERHVCASKPPCNTRSKEDGSQQYTAPAAQRHMCEGAR